MPSVCIISLTAIADDPRVRRQGNAFHRAGWEVLGLGLGESRSAPPDWPLLQTPAEQPLTAGLQRRGRTALDLMAARLGVGSAEDAFWRIYPAAKATYERAARNKFDAWLANDWPALVIAGRLQSKLGGILAYDTHECAADEYAHDWNWRFWRRPLIRTLETHYIKRAALVSTVSHGIGERLQELHRLPKSPLVIRNVPEYTGCEFRPTGDRVRLLYHGLIVPGRSLEQLIESVSDWPDQFSLTLRGPGDDRYKSHLATLIAARSLGDRIRLAEPIPMTALIREAAHFDVGVFAMDRGSPQREWVLPNKFFEYIMAGLALCVSDRPEMARILREHDLGIVIPDVRPKTIAAVIGRLDRETIDRFKQNSLRAARSLCWEHESPGLIAKFEEALGKGK